MDLGDLYQGRCSLMEHYGPSLKSHRTCLESVGLGRRFHPRVGCRPMGNSK